MRRMPSIWAKHSGCQRRIVVCYQFFCAKQQAAQSFLQSVLGIADYGLLSLQKHYLVVPIGPRPQGVAFLNNLARVSWVYR